MKLEIIQHDNGKYHDFIAKMLKSLTSSDIDYLIHNRDPSISAYRELCKLLEKL